MQKIKDLITKDNWCQGAYEKDAKGNDLTYSTRGEATRRCLSSWMEFVYGEDWFDVRHLVLRHLYPDIGIPPLVEDWNDTATFDQVKALVDELDI